MFEHFIEIIWLPKPCARHTRRTRNVVWAWHTSTVTPLSAWACSCQEGSTYFEGISLKSAPCRFGSLVLGCCLSNLLQSEHENCGSCIKNFHWNNFANGWKFAKFAKWKTHEILVLYGNIHTVVLGWNGTYLIAWKFNGGLKLAVWRSGLKLPIFPATWYSVVCSDCITVLKAPYSRMFIEDKAQIGCIYVSDTCLCRTYVPHP